MSASKRPSTSSLRRFVTSRPYVTVAELRRRFGLDDPDAMTQVQRNGTSAWIGLPEREAVKVQDLWLRGELGLELSVEVRAPVVVGIYPMRIARYVMDTLSAGGGRRDLANLRRAQSGQSITIGNGEGSAELTPISPGAIIAARHIQPPLSVGRSEDFLTAGQVSVIVLSKDLMQFSRILWMADAVGAQCMRFDRIEKLPDIGPGDLLLVDWDDRDPGWGLRLASLHDGMRPPRHMILFGPHTDLRAHQEARTYGIGPVVARSNLISTIRRLLAPV